MTTEHFSETDLEQLQHQLKAWRAACAGRARRRRLPEGVWKAATVLAGQQGVSRVARALHVDYYKLRQRTMGPRSARPATRRSPVPPGFVEVPVPWPTPARARDGGCTVELADGQGSRMTVRLAQTGPVLMALAQAFWSRRR
jgi:hypothetical protein